MNYQLYGLVGKKLSHSFSKKHFSEKFENEQIKAEYNLYELPNISSFPDLIAQNPHLCGLNVTIPYKTEVIPFLDALSPEAQAVGAVNTIKITQDKKLIGYNTDIYGFSISLKHFWKDYKKENRAFILGTGGASKAVEYVLRNDFLMENILKISRNKTENQNVLSYNELEKIDFTNALIVQTTPVGMYPNVQENPFFPFEKLNSTNFVIDLIYNPTETLFLSKAKENGAKICNGLEMLHLQAEKAWKIWQMKEYL
jgi:shikimate dehydrogenase